MHKDMLINSGLSEELWNEAVHCAASAQPNGQNEKTFELWFKRKPNLYRIRIFGSTTFMNIRYNEKDGNVLEE